MTAKLNVRRAWLAVLMFIALAGCAGMSLQDQINALMQEGQRLYAEKKYDESIGKFSEAIAKDPGYWPAYLWTARVFIVKGNWVSAITNAKKAFDLSPKGQDVIRVFAEALYGGGVDALKQRRYADAVGNFVEFLKLEPGNTGAWLSIGRAYLGQGQVREAFNAFVKGLSTASTAERSDLVRGLLDSGMQAFSRNDYRTAIDALREYIKFDARNLSAYLNLAKAYWESGDRASALDAFGKVVQLDPRNAEALKFLLNR